MKSKKLICYCLATMLFAYAGCIHAEDVYRCPPEISVSWSIPTPPTGWNISGTQKDRSVVHYLVSVTFCDGPPEDGAFLRPTASLELEGGDVVLEKYDFSDRVNSTIWMVCRYGNTPATLTKRIPEKLESCEVMRSKDLSEQKVRCRRGDLPK